MASRTNSEYCSKRKKREPQKILDKPAVIVPDSKARLKTRKARVIETFRNRNQICVKDKYGNNIKQHFGLWKYFINSSTAVRDRFYIALDCRKFRGAAAIERANYDKTIKSTYLSSLRKIGTEGAPNELKYWGLPCGICEKFHIKKLYDWQVACLKQAAEGNENLIYSAPTSGGKSLVAEIMMLRAVLSQKRRAIYVLPYISIVAEKAGYLRKVVEDINVKIEQFHGLCKLSLILSYSEYSLVAEC